MRTSIRCLALLGALALGACSSTGNVEDQIAQIRAQTRAICAFVPTVASVAKIIAAAAGGAGAVDLIGLSANQICDAVSTAPLAEGPGKRSWRVNGIKIEGHFVK